MTTFYRSTFRTDEAVHDGDIVTTGHRDVADAGLGPMDSEQVQGAGGDGQDVPGGTGEHVARVPVAPGAEVSFLVTRLMPGPVGVNQATNQGSGVGGNVWMGSDRTQAR